MSETIDFEGETRREFSALCERVLDERGGLDLALRRFMADFVKLKAKYDQSQLPKWYKRPDNWTHPDMCCDPLCLSYDFASRRGTVQLPEGSCTDGMGCVGIFRCIDGECEEITVISGNKIDIIYKPKQSAYEGECQRRRSGIIAGIKKDDE